MPVNYTQQYLRKQSYKAQEINVAVIVIKKIAPTGNLIWGIVANITSSSRNALLSFSFHEKPHQKGAILGLK